MRRWKEPHPNTTARGRRWAKAVRLREPTCRVCGSPTTDADHINGDNTDHRPENGQGLCRRHHQLKTTTERRLKREAEGT